MSSIQKTVYYFCVAKGNRILYSYSCGDREIDCLAALCLDRTPPFHSRYFQTMAKRTFGFLMEDEHVYFTIVDEGLKNSGALQFLEHIRDEFKKVARKGSRSSFSGLNSVCLQEQLVPVIHRLISSLEHVSQSKPLKHVSQCDGGWISEVLPSHHHLSIPPSPGCSGNTQIEIATHKAPLLGKSSKQERKMKDRVVDIRDNCPEEHRRSMDRGIKGSMTTTESTHQGKAVSAISLQKNSSSMRIRTGPQHPERRWCRKVLIVIVVDAVVCFVLFIVWLSICGGFRCISK
ncbi:PREDICTED: phytolongin Phyl1.1-like [Nelumbo nucifera]|uniref:Phytolongin Phyl1.1-like n=2 Tax=Nelumbo nucifera TaxID=4432 RepID=A0A1U8B8C8_NELNU|nr:PREDICTED: phytolongin Phyl1.1-like [Nelumbo nucifera]XP_010272542.1 PREDICTED: phytolongin Phyl1.1-like [Nelumbo nucifera]DAD24319.1 TPA_asm: hypothetical protein HUJ06_025783 [Nelumbo nucifera]